MNIELDLRHHWTYVRDQGARSSCLACSASDGHMFAQRLNHSLSAEYLFFNAAAYMPRHDVSDGLTFDALRQALENNGQPHESEWPYQQTDSNPWVPPVVSTVWKASVAVEERNHPMAIIEAIKKQPFVLAIKLTTEFIDVEAPSYIIHASGAGFGGHAVLVVGVAFNSQGEMHLLIRNSWGSDWGENGYAWLPIGYLVDKFIGFCELTVITNS